MYQPPELSNNPFLSTPSNPHTRFPDINTIEGSGPGPSGYNGGGGSGVSPMMSGSPYYGGSPSPAGYNTGLGYASPQQAQQMTMAAQSPGYPYAQQPQQQPQQQQGYASPYPGAASPYGSGGGMSQMGLSPMGMGSPTASSFGAAGYSNGMGMGMQSPYGQQQQQPGYGMGGGYGGLQAMQTGYFGGPGGQGGMGQQQQMGQYLSEFDPYGGQQNHPTPTGSTTASTTSTTSSSFSSTGLGPNGTPHPREYIRTHKLELEKWDTYAWKQCLNAFDELEKAWARRKGVVAMQVQQGAGSYYTPPQEMARLNGMQKEAESNIDTVAAARIQMQEVLSGYRHSGDFASKSRVRESTNAALQGLPDWPPS
ncbi:hypothetical protein BD410DRAFT_610900 [Rickenella mellea]|uniref:DUF1720 domain-containing protein n=1 Tax=Rickenella mellea TaxID=50990 RepID=A0A4Y7QDU9_9AGAM|nr:hypothetical protein BD410DRAFT_610900 [Rickenella mellea]